MANTLNAQIVESGPINAVVVVTGVLTDSNFESAPLFDLGDFALDENVGPGGGTLVGFRVMELEHTISDGLKIIPSWQADALQLIAPLAGRNKTSFKKVGGLRPDVNATGYTGGICLSSLGFEPGKESTFVLTMKLKKVYS